MSLTFTTTTKWALRKLVGSNLVSDIDAGFSALADDVDSKLTPHTSGLLSARPTSTVGTPGKDGRTYRATDKGLTGIGITYRDLGTSWLQIAGSEAPHPVGGSGEPAYENSWGSSGGDYGPPRFWIDVTGRVWLAGTAGHSGASTATAFTLPTGYRPLYVVSFPGVTGSTGVTINTDGRVVPTYSGTTLNLDGASFDPAR